VDAADTVYIPEHNGGLMSVLTLEGGDLYVVRPGSWGRGRRVVKYVRTA
jgi:hypothetical protein